MSARIDRFDPMVESASAVARMAATPYGHYVSAAHYDALAAECDQLKKDKDKLLNTLRDVLDLGLNNTYDRARATLAKMVLP